MEKQSKAAAILLRQLADMIDGLKGNDIDAVLENKKTLSLSSVSKNKMPTKSSAKIVSNDELDKAKYALNRINTREEAENYLDGLQLKKDDFLSLAKNIKVAIHSTDTTAMIRDKIVDATVGYRLRAKAIRGDDLPS